MVVLHRQNQGRLPLLVLGVLLDSHPEKVGDYLVQAVDADQHQQSLLFGV